MRDLISRIFKIDLSYRILISIFIGSLFGVLFRFYSEAFLNFGINVAGFKILGSIFIDLIKMTIAPLIFTSIVVSILSVGDSKKTGMLAIKSVTCFFVMTTISVILGVLAVRFFEPGVNISFDKDSILSTMDIMQSKAFNHKQSFSSLWEFVLNIIPSNIFHSFYDANFLQIIFFAIIFSIAIIKSNEQSTSSIIRGINGLCDIMFSISRMVMHFAPFGVFGLTAWLFGTQDVGLLKSLGFLIMILYGSCFTMVYVVYGLFSISILKLNPWHFYRKIFPSQTLGYLLASSAAALPMSLDIAEKDLGISREKSRFVIPLGATVNMNGGAIHLGISTFFIAQLYGINMSFGDIITAVILCVLGAIGTAPVPGASIFLLAGILSALRLPVEAIAIILAVDRILDMARTFTNISGDLFSAVIIDKLDGTLNKKIYNS